MRLRYDDNAHAYWLDGRRASGITTAAKIPDNNYAINQWRVRMVAIGMAMSPPLVERVAAHFDSRDQVEAAAEEALMVAKAHEAAGRGTAAHRITERVDLGEQIIDTGLSRAVTESWSQALDDAGLDIVPELVERIVVYPDLYLCGRFDRFARRRSDGRLVVLDLKTGANAVRYPHAIAIQLALYGHAPLMAEPIPAEGGETTVFEPLPADLDLDRGVIVHMPEDGNVEVFDIDIAAGWEAAQQIVFPTLEWRKRRDLVLPHEDPVDEQWVAAVEWARQRVEAVKAHGDGAARRRLAGLWSLNPEIPTFPRGGPRTPDELDKVAAWCDLVEMEFEVSFGPSDPRSEGQAASISRRRRERIARAAEAEGRAKGRAQVRRSQAAAKE